MNIKDAKEIINYLLDNNLKLVEKDQNKISIGLTGSPGIGKTSLIKEIADSRNAKFVKVELSSLEEIGDLIGVPIKEFVMTNSEGEELWVAEKLIDEYLSIGFKLCPDCSPRMNYAIPSWVPKEEEQEVILLLDDYTRANSLFMQAIMGLIQFNEYMSWRLPKKTHLMLTSNEDNGSMNISSLDSAQQTRLLNFNLDFDPKCYANWMDKQGLRSELINFVLLHPEIFDQSEFINARTFTMFTNALSSLSDLSSENSFNMIDLIAKGCFGKDTNIGNLLITFINNKLDKLMSAEEILKGDWKDVVEKLKENVF